MHHGDVPEVDRRHDITDLFVFRDPNEPGSSVLVLNVHPELGARDQPVDAEASYEVKIDSDGDLEPDLAFHVSFSGDGYAGTATVRRPVGREASAHGAVGDIVVVEAPLAPWDDVRITSAPPYRFFAGPRSDPFFADRVGFQNGMRWTGQDYFADKNVFSMVLGVPDDLFGASPGLSIWVRTVVTAHGAPITVNQAGRPGNNVLRPDAATFQTVPPAQQRERFVDDYVGLFESYGYSTEQAAALAGEWLPDVLRYDPRAPGGFPNGRTLTDDVVDNLVSVVTKGAVLDDRITSHSDLVAEFPFLGPPHR